MNLGLADIQARLVEREITLRLTDSAKKFIADEAYDPAYGARPVKRYLQRNLENQLAKMMISGEVKDGDKVTIDSDGEKLKFEV